MVRKGKRVFNAQQDSQSATKSVHSLFAGATVVEVEEEEPTKKDSFSLFGKDKWDKVREPKDEFNNMFEEESVSEEQDSVEANGVDVEAAKS